MKKTLQSAGWYLLSCTLFLLIWAILAGKIGNEYILPKWSLIFSNAGVMAEKSFRIAFVSTLLRSLEAFFLSFFAALITGVTGYMVKPFGKFLSPLIALMRSLPTMAILLLLFLWSTPSRSPITVGFLALYPILYQSIKAALEGCDKKLIEMSAIYKVPRKKQILYLYLPTAAPYFLKESAGALSFSLKLTVSAEIMANTYKSMGGLLQEAKIYAEVPKMFFLVLLVVLTGMIFELLGHLIAGLMERRFS